MKILSIETSCDETAITILECSGDITHATFTILGDALYSQAHLHAEYGGVYPALAKREHQKNLPLLLNKAMEQAGNVVPDLIAVTQGPGLEPALWQGIEFARALGEKLHVPVVGADHMEGHIISGLVTQKSETEYELSDTKLPLLALLISGGHTEFVLMRDWFQYELVGKTKDDAVGEAFDKVARMIGLQYPGGPKIEKLSGVAKARNAKHDIVFPRPMSNDDTCDFSFSGLKTAVLYKVRDMRDLSDQDKEHIAEAFQDAVRDVLVLKTRRALEKTHAQTLAVGGGVSASMDIRKGLETLIADEFSDVRIAYPQGKLHLDNAIMIGMAAYLRHQAGLDTRPLTALGSQTLAVIPSQNGS
jgi:N6-L-threonylcarbamoyladenine synthase